MTRSFSMKRISRAAFKPGFAMRVAQLRLLALLFVFAAPDAFAAVAGDGLLGTYYDQNNTSGAFFTGNTVTRIDPTVNFNWGAGAPAAGIGVDNFSVRWTGDVLTSNNGNYRFRTNSDDGVRLYLDRNRDGDFADANERLIDNWTDHGPTLDTTGNVNLTGNTRYPIMLEFYERGGGAVIELYWDLPGGGFNYVIIPQANLFSNVPPAVSSVVNGQSAANPCGDLQRLIVTWSADMLTGGGVNAADRAANYSIAGNTVTSAALAADQRTVTLTLANPLVHGTAYNLIVSNVQNVSGTNVNPNPLTTAFVALGGTLTSGGLNATYFDQMNLTGNSVERVDAQVNNDWGTGAPPVAGMPADGFSVRWEGFIDIPADYNGEFFTQSDDGVRLWVNNQLVIDNWTDHGSVQDRGAIALTPGQRYPILLEYYENGGDAVIQLGYEGAVDAIVSSASLSYCYVAVPLSHFDISVASGTASTCAPLAVGISARDAANNVISGYSNPVAINVSSNHGDWTIDTATGALTNGGGDNGDANYAFVTGDNGAIVLDFMNTHADDLTITVTDLVDGVGTASGTISFRDNTFLFTPEAPLDEEVIAGRAHSFTVGLYTREPSSGPSCTLVTDYAGAKNLKMWITRDAADPGSAIWPQIGGTDVTTAVASATVPLTFSGGEATLDLATGDVGKYTLHARDDTRTWSETIDIDGMSNVLTVRPFGLSVRGVNAAGTPNPRGTNAGDAVFASAGADFTATVAGVLWSGTVEDANGDFAPDAGVNLDDNLVTPSFRADVTLGAGAPFTPGPAGAFTSGTVAAASFSGGIAPAGNLQYREVGSMTVIADAQDYLGTAGVDIAGHSQPVGRFIPAYLTVEIPTHGCSNSPGFTYSGQPIGEVIVRAYNVQDEITQNYEDDFANGAILSDALGGLAGSFSNNAIDGTDFNNGVSANITDVAFTLTTKESGPGNIQLRATDADAVSSAGHLEETTEIRSGRVALTSTVSPETVDAAVPLTIEYWQEISPGVHDWDINAADACTMLSTGDFTLSNYTGNLSAGETDVNSVNVAAGDGTVMLDSPGNNDEGSVLLTGDTDAWLYYDWNGSGAEAPSAIVRFFGIYESEDGRIYIQEIIP